MFCPKCGNWCTTIIRNFAKIGGLVETIRYCHHCEIDWLHNEKDESYRRRSIALRVTSC